MGSGTPATVLALVGCDFTSGVRFNGAIISRSVLAQCTLSGSCSGTQLQRVTWTSCTLDASSSRAAALAQCALNGADLRTCHLYGLQAHCQPVHRYNFTGLQVPGIQFVRCTLQDADFTGADLSGADLTECNATGAHFQGTALARLQAPRGQFGQARFDKANLDGAQMESAVLKKPD